MKGLTFLSLTLSTALQLDTYSATASSSLRIVERSRRLDHTKVSEGETDIILIGVTWYTATFSWSSNHTTTTHYELYCIPMNSTVNKFNRTVILDGGYSNYTIKELQPGVSYQAWIMNHFSADVEVLRSNMLQFQTHSVPPDIAQTLLLSQIVDIILIACLLAFWGIACFVFYKQWSSFHIQLPNRYSHYKNVPKGLENIKVIKRAQDSVIYRNHNKAMNSKISERNRKLARMHTSPGALIELKEDVTMSYSGRKPSYKRRITALI